VYAAHAVFGSDNRVFSSRVEVLPSWFLCDCNERICKFSRIPGYDARLQSVHDPFLSSSYQDPPSRYPDSPSSYPDRPMTLSPLGFPPGDPFLPPSFPDISYSYPVLSPSYPDLTPDYPVSTRLSTPTQGYPNHRPRYLTPTPGYPTHKPGYPIHNSGHPSRTPGWRLPYWRVCLHNPDVHHHGQ